MSLRGEQTSLIQRSTANTVWGTEEENGTKVHFQDCLMRVWNAKVYFDHTRRRVVFEHKPGQRFELKPRDYEELYHEWNHIKTIKKKTLDSLPGPCVYFSKVKLPQSAHKWDIRIVILRTPLGFEAHLRVHPLCSEGFIRTRADYEARHRASGDNGEGEKKNEVQIDFEDFGFPLLRSDQLSPLPAAWYPTPSAALTASLLEEL